jgi:hemoglobin
VTAPAANSSAAQSMYLRVGGAHAVRRVVDRLYAWIWHDDVLYLRYFANIDKPTLKAHMVRLLSEVLGGPVRYTGRDLGVAHAHLRDSEGRPAPVTAEHYARVVDYVVAALLVEHPPADILEAVRDVLDSVKPQIVGAGHPA